MSPIPTDTHRAEFFSAVLEGAMIFFAALLILREAYHGFPAPRALDLRIEGPIANGVPPCALSYSVS
ncbi:hypothetical protein [Roseovarius spongiae]|uniref:hypothetical protein n=1 Tax=Roseovarius spongiae TaxID=2320272 RepID=UPI0019818167